MSSQMALLNKLSDLLLDPDRQEWHAPSASPSGSRSPRSRKSRSPSQSPTARSERHKRKGFSQRERKSQSPSQSPIPKSDRHNRHTRPRGKSPKGFRPTRKQDRPYSSRSPSPAGRRQKSRKHKSRDPWGGTERKNGRSGRNKIRRERSSERSFSPLKKASPDSERGVSPPARRQKSRQPSRHRQGGRTREKSRNRPSGRSMVKGGKSERSFSPLGRASPDSRRGSSSPFRKQKNRKPNRHRHDGRSREKRPKKQRHSRRPGNSSQGSLSPLGRTSANSGRSASPPLRSNKNWERKPQRQDYQRDRQRKKTKKRYPREGKRHTRGGGKSSEDSISPLGRASGRSVSPFVQREKPRRGKAHNKDSSRRHHRRQSKQRGPRPVSRSGRSSSRNRPRDRKQKREDDTARRSRVSPRRSMRKGSSSHREPTKSRPHGRSQRPRSGREVSPTKRQRSRSRHDRKRDRGEQSQVSSSPREQRTGSRNRSSARDDGWQSRERGSRKPGRSERPVQQDVFREDEKRNLGGGRGQSDPSNSKYIKRPRPLPRGQPVDKPQEQELSRRTSSKGNAPTGRSYEEHKHQEAERERITEVSHSRTTTRVYSQYSVRTTANFSEGKKLGKLRGKLEREMSQLQTIEDRIENLLKQQKELEDKAMNFKRVQIELEVYKQQHDRLEQRMEENNNTIIRIQENEDKKRKFEKMQKDLDTSREAMQKWNSRVKNLEETLTGLGVSTVISTESVQSMSVGNVALQEQPIFSLDQPSHFSQLTKDYGSGPLSFGQVASRSNQSIEYGRVPPLLAHQKTKSSTQKSEYI